MKRYLINENEMFEFLEGVINLYHEYMVKHSFPHPRARMQAVLDTIEGLDAEDELYRHGDWYRTHVEDSNDFIPYAGTD